MFPPRFSMTRTVIVVLALLAPGCSSDSNHPIPDNDVPAIASLDPAYAVEGDAAFDLFVHGQGFDMNSVVRWNGSDRVTTLTNPSPGVFVLRASIPSQDVAAQTTAQITVFNPPPAGGASNTVNFVVYDPSALNPVPTTSTVSPTTVTHSQDVTITVNGTGFVSGSTVTWKPAATTNAYTETNVTIVNSTQLTVAIPAAHVTPSGAATLKVVNPPPGGGTSDGETVNIL